MKGNQYQTEKSITGDFLKERILHSGHETQVNVAEFGGWVVGISDTRRKPDKGTVPRISQRTTEHNRDRAPESLPTPIPTAHTHPKEGRMLLAV